MCALGTGDLQFPANGRRVFREFEDEHSYFAAGFATGLSLGCLGHGGEPLSDGERLAVACACLLVLTSGNLRRAKTDGVDVGKLLRSLIAYLRGDPPAESSGES